MHDEGEAHRGSYQQTPPSPSRKRGPSADFPVDGQIVPVGGGVGGGVTESFVSHRRQIERSVDTATLSPDLGGVSMRGDYGHDDGSGDEDDEF